MAEPSAVEYTDLFIQQLPPYASVYLGIEGKIGGEARDRIAGFWRAMRLTPPPEPDHLASLLGLWASITEQSVEESEPERRGLLAHAAVTLVWEHLAPWLTPYLARVGELSEAHGGWADLVAAVINDTLDSATRGFNLPVHLAVDSGDQEESEDLVPYLLTPIRSGLVLTRADLIRAAADLGLGTRIGERAFDLRSLLEQDGQAVIEWMATEAKRQADLYAASSTSPTLGDLWSSRASRTHAMATELVK
ncbi:MAG: molecular chaperone TorD family protein [Actinomycetota bacterium]